MPCHDMSYHDMSRHATAANASKPFDTHHITPLCHHVSLSPFTRSYLSAAFHPELPTLNPPTRHPPI